MLHKYRNDVIGVHLCKPRNKPEEWGYHIYAYWQPEDLHRSYVDDDRCMGYATADLALAAAQRHVDLAYDGMLGPPSAGGDGNFYP